MGRNMHRGRAGLLHAQMHGPHAPQHEPSFKRSENSAAAAAISVTSHVGLHGVSIQTSLVSGLIARRTASTSHMSTLLTLTPDAGATLASRREVPP